MILVHRHPATVQVHVDVTKMALKQSNKKKAEIMAQEEVTYTKEQTCSIVSNLVFGVIVLLMGIFLLVNIFIFPLL